MTVVTVSGGSNAVYRGMTQAVTCDGMTGGMLTCANIYDSDGTDNEGSVVTGGRRLLVHSAA